MSRAQLTCHSAAPECARGRAPEADRPASLLLTENPGATCSVAADGWCRRFCLEQPPLPGALTLAVPRDSLPAKGEVMREG